MYSRSSTALPMVCTLYFPVDGSGLLILSLVNGFHDGLHTVLLSGWQRIAHSSVRQCLSRQFSRHIAPWMAADSSFFHTSMAFTTVCAPYCSADGSALLILSLVNGFHNGFRSVLLRGWQRIAHSSAHRFSQRFARHIACRIARCINYSSARTRLCQLFACRMAQRKVTLLICGFTRIFCLSMTLLTFYTP